MLLVSQVACICVSAVQCKRIYNQIKVKAFRFWQCAFPLWTEQAVPTKLVFTKRGSMIKLHLLWRSPSSECICHKKPQRIQKVYRNSKVFPLLSTHSFQKALSVPHSTCRKQVTYFMHSYFKKESFQSDQLKKKTNTNANHLPSMVVTLILMCQGSRTPPSTQTAKPRVIYVKNACGMRKKNSC